MQDSNVVCVSLALQGLANLAAGLRRDFTHYARMFSKDLFEKFKDKSSAVQKATHEVLTSFRVYCVPLDDM